MDNTLLKFIACPLCKSALHYNDADRVLVCRAERLAFPVEDGRPLLLETSARSLSVDETDRLTGRTRPTPNV